MIKRKCLALLTVSLAALEFVARADAMSSHNGVALDSENIAASALSVAESTRSSGRCYAAVCRALRPLGVDLHGAAAYQARDLLIKDSRFVPLSIHSVDELRAGDIIVYTQSRSHPYGHISVYEGSYEEASDHLSSITHTQAYGSATVFRLRNEYIASAKAAPPVYSGTDSINRQPTTEPGWQEQAAPPARESQWQPHQVQPVSGSNSPSKTIQILRRGYRLISGEPIERTIARKCAHFLLQSY